MPPPFPAAQPRDDSRFGPEAPGQMAAREADVQRRLAAFPNLRLVRGQAGGQEARASQTYLIAALARPGSRRPALMEPGGSSCERRQTAGP